MISLPSFGDVGGLFDFGETWLRPKALGGALGNMEGEDLEVLATAKMKQAI